MLLTLEVDVLVFSESDECPRRSSEYPGIFVRVHGDDGANCTIDNAGLSVGVDDVVLDHKAQDSIAKEADGVIFEDDGHDR